MSEDLGDPPSGVWVPVLPNDPLPVTTTNSTTYGYADTILRDKPVGYWRMDAASGTTELDLSGNRNNGTISGGVSLNQSGAIGDGDKAELFNGSSGMVRITSAAVLNVTSTLTVEAWVRFTITTSLGFLVSKSTGGANGFELFRTTGTGQMRWSASASSVTIFDITTTPAFNDGAWHHVVGTYDPVTAQKAVLYVDGANLASASSLTTLLSVDASDLFIAARGGSGSLFFAGSIDDIAIYNVALTATQVAMHYAIAQSSIPIAQPVRAVSVTPSALSATDLLIQQLYVGIGGDVTVIAPQGNTYTLSSVPSGTQMPLQAIGIAATGTTALNLLALYAS